MINTPTGSIKLTLENMQLLAEMEGRVSVLQSEIDNREKIIKGMKKESDRAVKDKAYQEELLATSITQAEAKTKELKGLNDNITEKTAQLNELLSQFKEHTDLMTSEKASHDDRESKIVSRETEISNQGSDLGKKEIILNNDKADFNSKVAKLKEVISKF